MSLPPCAVIARHPGSGATAAQAHATPPQSWAPHTTERSRPRSSSSQTDPRTSQAAATHTAQADPGSPVLTTPVAAPPDPPAHDEPPDVQPSARRRPHRLCPSRRYQHQSPGPGTPGPAPPPAVCASPHHSRPHRPTRNATPAPRGAAPTPTAPASAQLTTIKVRIHALHGAATRRVRQPTPPATPTPRDTPPPPPRSTPAPTRTQTASPPQPRNRRPPPSKQCCSQYYDPTFS